MKTMFLTTLLFANAVATGTLQPSAQDVKTLYMPNACAPTTPILVCGAGTAWTDDTDDKKRCMVGTCTDDACQPTAGEVATRYRAAGQCGQGTPSDIDICGQGTNWVVNSGCIADQATNVLTTVENNGWTSLKSTDDNYFVVNNNNYETITLTTSDGNSFKTALEDLYVGWEAKQVEPTMTGFKVLLKRQSGKFWESSFNRSGIMSGEMPSSDITDTRYFGVDNYWGQLELFYLADLDNDSFIGIPPLDTLESNGWTSLKSNTKNYFVVNNNDETIRLTTSDGNSFKTALEDLSVGWEATQVEPTMTGFKVLLQQQSGNFWESSFDTSGIMSGDMPSPGSALEDVAAVEVFYDVDLNGDGSP